MSGGTAFDTAGHGVPGGGVESKGAIARFFHFEERKTDLATEVRAGFTTFFVMAYIIFVNANILMGGFGQAKTPDAAFTATALAAGTALVAGVVTIVMGLVSNYPFALAAGLGINGVVAFTLVAGDGLTPAGAMGVIVLEGLTVTVLVLVGLREAIMNAVPIALKRAIGVGIGLFILFIGFADGGLVKTGTPLVTISFPTTVPQAVFLIGLAITVALYVMRVRAALIISILATTAVALVANQLGGGTQFPGGGAVIPKDFALTPSFSTLGHFDLGNVFSVLGILQAAILIYAIMLTDFFDTMGTVTGVAAEAGLARPDGSVPGVGRILMVDSLAAVAGGAAGVSSNTTYIESAAGVGEGGRTGLTAIVTGVLFLIAVLLAPIAGIIPAAATAPALVLVGYLMFQQVRDIPVTDPEEGIPALLTMILMPLTYGITAGIGAGFVSWVFIKLIRGKAAQIHPLMYLVAAGFLVFFAQDWILSVVPK